MSHTSTAFLHRFFRWLGFFCLAIPFAFQWYITDADRYIAMLRGPYPFNLLGSFDYQLVGTIIVPALFAISAWYLSSSWSVPRHMNWTEAPYRSGARQKTALIFALVALVLLGFAFLPPLVS